MASSSYKKISGVATPAPRLKQSVGSDTGSFEHTEASFWVRQFRLGTPAQLAASRLPTGAHNVPARHVVIRTKSNFPVHHVSFRPTVKGPTRQMAVASGPRVALYPLKNATHLGELRADRNLSLGDVAHCSEYRADGRLLAIGSADGAVKVVDVTTRATLRTFGNNSNNNNSKGNKLTVRSVAWFRDGRRLASGGDDALLRVWDLNGRQGPNKPTLQLRGHADSVRVCRLAKHDFGDGNVKTLAVTGSYDHTVRVWDVGDDVATKEDRCLAVIDHGAPVEDVIVLPDDNDDDNELLVLSAGGTTIKLWNALTGRLLTTLDNAHAKTISTLCLVTPAQLQQRHRNSNVEETPPRDDHPRAEQLRLPRIISGGLDGLLRVHSVDTATATITTLHGLKHADPITAIHLSPDGGRLVVGTATGLLSLRHRRRTTAVHPSSAKRKRTPRGGTLSYFQRGTSAGAPGVDDAVAVPTSSAPKRLHRFDRAVRQFRYGDALDEALATKNPAAVVAVLEELAKRRGLVHALSNRNEETLEPILSFTARYVAQPRFSPLLIGVVSRHLTEIYGNVMGQSAVVDELFQQKLRDKVRTEVAAQQDLLALLGQIDAVLYRQEVNHHNNNGGGGGVGTESDDESDVDE